MIVTNTFHDNLFYHNISKLVISKVSLSQSQYHTVIFVVKLVQPILGIVLTLSKFYSLKIKSVFSVVGHFFHLWECPHSPGTCGLCSALQKYLEKGSI